jgi:hypothetical protein
MKPWLVTVTFVFLAASHAAAISAQNLVVNPNFDAGLSGWQAGTQEGETASWDSTMDAGGSTASGSAKGVFAFTVGGGFQTVVSQCLELTPGASYALSGKAFIHGGQTGATSAVLGVIRYIQPACSGPLPPGNFMNTSEVTALDAWTPTAGTFTSFGPSAMIAAYVGPTAPGSLAVNFDDIVVRPAAAGCVPDAHTLCSQAGRFEATAVFDAGNGNVGAGHAVQLDGDSGYFWFFDASNPEAVVKVIDGCALGGHFWFFAGGLTNVRVVISVTDTQTGVVKNYTNPANTAFAPIQDTTAFSCP